MNNLQNLLNDDFISTPQSHHKSSFYGIRSIDYSNILIDFNKTAFQIDLQLELLNLENINFQIIKDMKLKD